MRRRHEVSVERAVNFYAWDRILLEADKYCRFRTHFVILVPNLFRNVELCLSLERLKQLHFSRNTVKNVVRTLQLFYLRIMTHHLVVHELRIVMRTFPIPL